RKHAWAEPAATVAAIARHLEFAVDESAAPEVAANLAADPAALPAEETQAWWQGLGGRAKDIVEGALGPYLADGKQGQLGQITWTGDLFFLGDRQEERATGPIDITGRPRCLVHGPNILLP